MNPPPPALLCLLCAAPLTEVVTREAGHALRACLECRTLQLAPLPDPAVVRAIYEHDQAQTSSRQLLAKSKVPYARQHNQHLLDLLRPHQAGGDLLELGPGGGLFLHQAQAAGYRVAGLEPNPVQRAFIAEQWGIAVSAGPLGEGEADCDALVHCNVLSHLPDPVGAFAAMARRLRPGGVLLFETGNYGELSVRFRLLVAQTERWQLPDHLVFYSERALRRLLKGAGFEVLAIHRYSRVAEKLAPRWLGRLGLRRLAERWRHLLLYRLGAILPKERRPQALIVVARRRG